MAREREPAVQDALGRAFPNVTAIPVRDIVERVTGVLDRIGMAVRVVALEAFDEPKTARLAKAVAGWETGGGKVLLLTAGQDQNLVLSGRNLPRVTVKKFRDASALDVLLHDVIAVEDGAWSTRPAPGGGKDEVENDG